MTHPGRKAIEELVAGVAKLRGSIAGKWQIGYRGADIGCENEKIGGFAKLFDVRGWVYLTGAGHGGLGLDFDEAAALQDAYTKHVINASPDAILSVSEYVRTLQEENDRLKRELGRVVERSLNGELGSSKVNDMRRIASEALQSKSTEAGNV